MKKILVILICLGILMGSTLTVIADDEHDPYIQAKISNKK